MANTTNIDYTSRDYTAIYNDLVNAIPHYLPAWTSTSSNDFGHVLLQLFAYVGDITNYYIDRVANESFLVTATQRSSVLNIANMLGYVPYGTSAASGTVTFTTTGTTAVTIPALTQVQALVGVGSDIVTVTYETANTLTIYTGSTTGTVTVNEGVTVTGEQLGSGTGLAQQEYILFNTPVIDGTVTVYVDGSQWTQVQHLVDYQATDKVYEVFTDSNSQVHVLFGDSINGQAPWANAAITCTYRVGGGSIGNVSPGAINLINAQIDGLVAVTNSLSTTGGVDSETNDHIRNFAPLAISTLGRAVTLNDYGNLALLQPYIAKARATASTYSNVSVYVGPPGGGVSNVTLSDGTITSGSTTLTSLLANFTSADLYGLVQVTGAGVAGATLTAVITAVTDSQHVTLGTAASTSVSNASWSMLNRPLLVSSSNKSLAQSYLSSRCQAGASVTVTDPYYVRTNITATYNVLPQYKQSVVSTAVTSAINLLLTYDAVILGDTITLSDVMAAITSVPGIDYVANVQYLNRDFVINGGQIASGAITSVTLRDNPIGITYGDTIQFVQYPNTSVEAVVGTGTVSGGTGGTQVSGTTLSVAATLTGVAHVIRQVTPYSGPVNAQYNANEIPLAGKISLTAIGGVP